MEEPVIRFGLTDLEGVIAPTWGCTGDKATIANYDVTKMFVGSRSSVNILFNEAFNQMQLDLVELRPLSTSLFGFIGH